jgi:putative mRNA 3-end processing factor
MELHCLGASGEVGRSAFLLKTDKTLLLDYGIKIFDKSGQPKFPEETNIEPDLAIISHAHLDHSGYIPYLYTYSKTQWLATPPTRDIVEILIADSMKIMQGKLPFGESEYKKMLKYWIPTVYGRKMQIGKTDISFHDAGHISGSAMVDIKYDGKKLLYTGDFKSEETRLHEGEKYKDEVDVLVIESTYSNREHPERRDIERKLADEISETLKEGGNILLPAFSLGRSQELIRIIRAYHKRTPIYLDGMGKSITDVYLKYPEYIKDAKGFKKEVEGITKVSSPEDRMDAVKKPSVIVSSAGMLEGGPALGYLTNINSDSKIIFTGYNVEGTNGWRLINEGEVMIDGNELSVDLPVEYLDFSAHAGRNELLEFVKKVNPQKIVCVHGDKTIEFAQELSEMGFDAVAPRVGETIEL